ncbi:MAG: hypothetical protein OXD34_16170 [bacterium]|nr:hypothetical protein [bacterium]
MRIRTARTAQPMMLVDAARLAAARPAADTGWKLPTRGINRNQLADSTTGGRRHPPTCLCESNAR